jgi:hypothetical protein
MEGARKQLSAEEVKAQRAAKQVTCTHERLHMHTRTCRKAAPQCEHKAGCIADLRLCRRLPVCP